MENKNCVWYKDICGLYNTDECNDVCIRYLEMSNLCKLARIPKNLCKPILLHSLQDNAAYSQLKSIKDDIYNWVSSGKNVYIYSDITGNGKTTWAIKLMLAYFAVIWSGNGFKCRGVYLPVCELIRAYRGKFGENSLGIVESDIINSDLVIFDDIGISSLTAFEHQILMSFIDRRISLGKSNIYTSNVDFAGLQNCLGDRLASRIWHTSEHIKFVDDDKRGSAE